MDILYVTGTSVSKCGNTRYTSGMVGAKVRVIYDETWDGMAKVICFTNGCVQRDVVATSDIVEIPHEVLAEPFKEFKMGFYGSAEKTATPTVWCSVGNILLGTDPNGDETVDPTNPVYIQILNLIGNVMDLKTVCKKDLVCAINEIYEAGGSGGTVNDAVIKKLIAEHNASITAHNDIRLKLAELAKKLNAFLDSDDQTLDQLTELIQAIKANQGTIEQLTNGKVNVSDIVNDLVSNVSDKPLSAAQGVELKRLIDSIKPNETAVLYTPQKLTPEQQEQAQRNIGIPEGGKIPPISPEVKNKVLSNDGYNTVWSESESGKPANVVTTVPIELKRASYNQFYDGVVTSGSCTSTVLFRTPQRIRIETPSDDLFFTDQSLRFANTADYASAEYKAWWDAREAGIKHEIKAGGTYVFETNEYGRQGFEYIQLKFQPDNWSNAWTRIKVYAEYDSVFPAMATAPVVNDMHVIADLPMSIFPMASQHNAYIMLYCAVPYIPETTYYIRGCYWGYTETHIEVLGFPTDLQFSKFASSWSDGSSDKSVPFYRGMLVSTEAEAGDKTPAYDETKRWVSVTTPSTEVIPYCKWLVVAMGQTRSFPTDIPTIEEWNAYIKENVIGGAMYPPAQYYQKDYISLHNMRIDRRLDTVLAFPVADPSDGWMANALMANSNNPLVGAKWVAFGDSISDDFGGHDISSNYFMGKICKEFCMTIDNRAKSGSNIYAGGSGNYPNVSGIVMLDAFLEEIANGTPEPDYITVFFGANQFTGNVGSPSDTSAQNTASAYGATRYFVEKIREKCPDSILGFILPYDLDWALTGQGDTHDVDTGRGAMKKVLDELRVPYIDLYTDSGITTAMLPDGVHPKSETAQKRLYHSVRRFMMGL